MTKGKELVQLLKDLKGLEPKTITLEEWLRPSKSERLIADALKAAIRKP